MTELIIRILVCALILCVACAMFCSCDLSDNTDQTDTNNRFKMVYEQGAASAQIIIVDTETGVMYLYKKNGYSGGLTVMVDQDGKPLIWESEDGE